MLTQVQFRLPDTLAGWPWPRAINPYHDEVKAECEKWVHSFNALGPKSQVAFDQCNICLLGSLSNPHLDRESLRTACEVLILSFLFDEFTDRVNSDQAREYGDIVMDALRNPHKPRPKGECILGEIFRQFWERGIRTMSTIVQERFIKEFKDFTDSVVIEGIDRETSRIRTIEEYLKLRRFTVGIWPNFVALQFGMKGLPDEVVLHPTVVKLSVLLNDAVLLDNDLLSYNREQAAGEGFHNIITVVMAELKVDLDGALAWLEKRRAQIAADVIAGWDTLPEWDEDVREDARTYLQGMAGWVRSSYTWQFESERYFGKHGREIQEHRMVTLLPKTRNRAPCANGPDNLADLGE
ncbi:terpenoid synthase [Artomyces pyxidatus]|uniref:Terpenoid synthase n=2 Tax=Artomyces pyxidatus TaxID=48021 RepID=A0ACB8SIS0_9AGAM|nr:terpenoid synthase [Artomyces pyxidatus]KAI0056127.1 terpenoid synthase [Artomyces pyxidatus]